MRANEVGTDALRAAYTRLNNSFSDKLVFRVGVNAGFFSEYNNMVLAMLYCLKHRIRFVLSSGGANFGNRRGWRDYFDAFTHETRLGFHTRYNYRAASSFAREVPPDRQRLVRVLKRVTRTTYLTHELFDDVRAEAKSKHIYRIPELGIDGDIRDATRVLLAITWQFNTETRQALSRLIRSASVPPKYVGLHIRSGDKAIEAGVFDVARYIDIAQRESDLRDAFVATDDYTNVEALRARFPEWSFAHLSREQSRGYDQQKFNRLTAEQKREELLDLLASVEILSAAEVFVGTFTSNVGMFLGIRRDGPSYGVDSRDWFVW